MDYIFVIILAVSAPAGMLIGFYAHKQYSMNKANSAEAKAQNIIREADAKKKELILQAKDRAMEIVEATKREEARGKSELKSLQQRLEKRESLFDQRLLDLENRQQKVTARAGEVEKIREQIQKIRQDQLQKLEKIGGLSRDEAKKVLMDHIEQTMQDDLMQRIRKLENTQQEEFEMKARNILSTVIQRCAASHAAESTTTTVTLTSDEMKGRIIGREGRNIRALEQLTGVEIIVDDTPEVIVISGFSPIRRHLAKRALENLMADGRIHPARIEEAVQISKQELVRDIQKAGEEALYEAGITGIDPKLVQIVGRLKYRTSYGQNVLRHSIEIAHLAAMLAEELDGDPALARKAGFFHDIGKAVDHEVQGTHTEIGANILHKFNFSEAVIKAAMQHHDDRPETLEGVIVKSADAISGARPGARKDTYEQYIQRLDELEKVAADFSGVERVYAIQAGREVRIFVSPEKISDFEAHNLARDIAKQIEAELKYPGEIKVHVIRETRVVEYAR